MLMPEISGGDNSISPVHALIRTAGPISSGHRGRRAINERPYGGVRRADEVIRPLYYRVVAFIDLKRGLCYNAEDVVDWLRPLPHDGSP